MKLNTLSIICFSNIMLAACNGASDADARSTKSANSPKATQKVKLVSSINGYLPVELKNDSKIISDDKIYVIGIAKTDEKTPRQCLINFKTGDCNVVTNTEEVEKHSNTTLNDIEKDGNGNRIVHVLHVQSGRIYFSINQPLSLYFDKLTHTIPDPDGFKNRDPNYYTLYDKVEFSFVSGGVWFNPTAVDFFSLPIEITDNDSVTVKSAGLVDSRTSVLDNAQKIFNESDKTSSHEWSKLFLKYNGNTIRLMSPGKAMVEVAGQENNPFKNNPFPPKYLADPEKFGFNYIDSVWTYYRTNELKVNAQELEGQKDDAGKTLPVSCDNGTFTLTNYMFTGKVSNNDFIFTNKDGCSVKLSNPQSISFFAGAVGSFDAPNNTPKAVIVREITSAFDVGLLPAPDKTILSEPKEVMQNGTYQPNINNYFIKNRNEGNYYKDNPLLGTTSTGPWYDLYSKALHSYGHVHPIYTFAYDDALGQDGTIHEGNGNNPGKVTITLHDLTGTVIPNPLAQKTGFDVYLTVPEALYVYKTVTTAPITKSDFAGFDMIFDVSNGILYQLKDDIITKLEFSAAVQAELESISKLPRASGDEITLFNGAMKTFLIKNKETLAAQGLTLQEIKVDLENGPNGVEHLHDGQTGANHLMNATSPLKLKINGRDVSIYLDPYIILPNDPEFDGIILQRIPGTSEKDVNITLPGIKPKN